MAISLSNPIAIGSTNWGGLVNGNWTAIANAFSTTAPFTGIVIIAPTAISSGVQKALTVTGAANTGMTASAEVNDVLFSLNRTVQWATGALITQRAVFINAPTYAFVGASTITNAATFAISGAPTAGTNASITNSYALWVQGGNCLFAGTMTMANGTFAGTTAINSVNITPTYTGSVTGSAVISTLTSSPVFTPSGASTAIYLGAYINPSVSSQANTNLAASSLIGMSLTPQFATANTSGVNVLTEIIGVDIETTVSTTNAMGTNTIPNIFGIHEALTATSSGGGGLTIANYYAVYLAAPSLTTSTITTSYGIYQADGKSQNVFLGTMVIADSIFTNTTALTTVLVNPNFTGAASTVGLAGINSNPSIAPTGASTASYYGILTGPGVSAANNNFLAGANIYGAFFDPSMNSANTTSGIILNGLAGVYSQPTVQNVNSSGTNTISNVYGFWTLSFFSVTGGGSLTITNSYGIFLATAILSTAAITNRYGVYQQDPSATNFFAGNKYGFYGATPVAQSTGWGTPTGNVKTSNFPGATATLIQTAEQLAQLLLDLKAIGFLGA